MTECESVSGSTVVAVDWKVMEVDMIGKELQMAGQGPPIYIGVHTTTHTDNGCCTLPVYSQLKEPLLQT